MKTTNSLRRFCLLILICVCLLSACRKKITVTEVDDTPPYVTLRVNITDEDEIVLNGVSDPTIWVVDRLDTIIFSATGRD